MLQAPSGELSLHRVCHGIFLEDETSQNATFTTTEYTHTPQDGYDGFGGTFAPTPNPLYDPKNSKSGLKHLQRHGMKRDDICLFVDTFCSGKELYLTAGSIALPATVCSQPGLPLPLPLSHQRTTALYGNDDAQHKSSKRVRSAAAVSTALATATLGAGASSSAPAAESVCARPKRKGKGKARARKRKKKVDPSDEDGLTSFAAALCHPFRVTNRRW
eukprot:6196566-Pleurochrysis_carterae.AAC.1